MIKTISVVIVFLAIILESQAQSSLALGLRVSGHIGSFETENNTKFFVGRLPGFSVGGYLQLNFRRLYFAPELCYTFRGASLVSYNGTEELVLRQHHLDLPLLVGFEVVKQEGFRMAIQAGPMASYLLGAGGNISDVAKLPADTRPKDLFNSVIWSYQAGISLVFNYLNFDLRYESNLTPASSPEGESVLFQKTRLYNSLFRVGVGFHLIYFD